MRWYHYVAYFFGGAFLTNAIPHLVSGVTGHPFQSPFASPPGEGLSSAMVNVVWGFFNLVVGYVLFRAGKVSSGGDPGLIVFFAGIAAISIAMSVRFASKQSN